MATIFAIPSAPTSVHDSAMISGPDGPPATRYQPDHADFDEAVTEWMNDLWARRITRLKHSRWNTRWASAADPDTDSLY